ncbi:MAG: ABC transporter ATP-binding protein, partial [Myxococcales bacterium]|nr:ABC transporter ATP-binding protein [Myxococcales bacterium]
MSARSLRIEGLGGHVAGPPPRWLFRGLDLTITPGELWALVGPNGSGKSTLLRCLAGLRPPEEGSVWLGEARLSALPARERATRVAYLPQLTPLYHDLEVRQLVMLGRAPHLSRWRPPAAEDVRRIDLALERVHATTLASRRVSTLSGGERQRVMLARLLATEAPLLLLDEPTTALDIGHALRLLALCRELAAEGAALVLALHELDLARRHADHAVCLGAGPDGQHRKGPSAAV